ncbi:DNA/RNA polymerases superfamily protein [Gossypium australe]|uniref:DNA/RNA polymerases superfamily protein n=1 Tax=Gossypium australe TaxID=47621 RepID=A0A5B6WF85_9ROSI|nr:DNA/RNA polymerases superfamily protein [Gossypium australe]
MRDMKCELISTVSTKKLVLQGVDSHLAYIMNIMVVRKNFEQVSILSQFLDFFLEELSRIALRTAPISCALYRIVPLKLKKAEGSVNQRLI